MMQRTMENQMMPQTDDATDDAELNGESDDATDDARRYDHILQ